MSGLNPDWTIELGREWSPGIGSLGANDFSIYTVDAKTGWIGCAAMPQSEVAKLLVEAPKAGLTAASAHDIAAQLVGDAADAKLGADSVDYESTMLMAALGITKTKTFELGVSQGAGSMAGHWVYIVYRTASGEYVGRPAMMKRSQPGLLSPDELRDYAREVIRIDTKVPGTSVGELLNELGGASIWSGLK